MPLFQGVLNQQLGLPEAHHINIPQAERLVFPQVPIAHQHTYSELADLLGVPRVTLRKWIDNDQIAPPQTAARIKEFLRLRA